GGLLRARVRGVGGRAPEVRGVRARRVRLDRPRAEGPADRSRARSARDSVRRVDRRGRAGGARAVRRHRVVRVPASSANLGPGYDSMAAALALHLELEVEETGRELSVDAGGADLPSGRDNLCVRAFEALHPADGIAFQVRSEI